MPERRAESARSNSELSTPVARRQSAYLTPRVSELEVQTESSALFAGTLQLYGNVRIPGAKYYQVLRSVDHGAGFAPFTGLTWPVYRVVGGRLEVLWMTPDSSGWYPVLPESDHWFPDTLLLEWQPEGQGR